MKSEKFITFYYIHSGDSSGFIPMLLSKTIYLQLRKKMQQYPLQLRDQSFVAQNATKNSSQRR